MSAYIPMTSELQQMSMLNYKYTVSQIKLNTYGKFYFKPTSYMQEQINSVR